MTHADLEDFAGDFISEASTILFSKNEDYAKETDALDNFKSEAKELGVSPRVLWSVYFHKHISAIKRWARDGKVSSEEIRGRFLDVMNYCILGCALATEEADGSNTG